MRVRARLVCYVARKLFHPAKRPAADAWKAEEFDGRFKGIEAHLPKAFCFVAISCALRFCARVQHLESRRVT